MTDRGMIQIDPTKGTVKAGFKLILSGIIVTAYGICHNANHAVKRYPWVIIGVITVLYIVASVTLFVHCRASQVTAEAQRDSIGMELDRITSTAYYKYAR